MCNLRQNGLFCNNLKIICWCRIKISKSCKDTSCIINISPKHNWKVIRVSQRWKINRCKSLCLQILVNNYSLITCKLTPKLIKQKPSPNLIILNHLKFCQFSITSFQKTIFNEINQFDNFIQIGLNWELLSLTIL